MQRMKMVWISNFFEYTEQSIKGVTQDLFTQKWGPFHASTRICFTHSSHSVDTLRISSSSSSVVKYLLWSWLICNGLSVKIAGDDADVSKVADCCCDSYDRSGNSMTGETHWNNVFNLLLVFISFGWHFVRVLGRNFFTSDNERLDKCFGMNIKKWFEWWTL